MTSTKNFYFKEANKYTLSNSTALEISANQLRMKDLGEYYSDQNTVLLMHLNESSGIVPINSAKYFTTENLVDPYTSLVWADIVDPKLSTGSYKLKYTLADTSVVFGLGDCNGNSFLSLYNGATPNADVALGDTAFTLIGASIAMGGGYLICNATGAAGYSVTHNADFTQLGTIRVVVGLLGYTHAPALKSPIISIPNLLKNGLYLYQEPVTGNVILEVVDSAGVTHIKDFGTWDSHPATDYVFTLQMDFTTGATKLFVNGGTHSGQLGTTWSGPTGVFTRTTLGLTVMNVGNLGDLDPLVYFNGSFRWVSVHRNFISPISLTEPVWSPSGSLTILDPAIFEYKLYYDIDEEIVSGEDQSLILKLISIPAGGNILHTPVQVVSISSVSDGFTNATVGVSGLFNKTGYSFNGLTNYAKMKYSTGMNLSFNGDMSVDASIYISSFGSAAEQMCVVGNINLSTTSGWYLSVSKDLSKLYFYKNSLNEYATASVPAGAIKLNSYHRISVEYDPALGAIYNNNNQPLKVYLDKNLLEIKYGETTELQNITGVSILGCTCPGVSTKILSYTVVAGAHYLTFDGGVPVNITSASAGDIYALYSVSSGYLIIKITDPSLYSIYNISESVDILKFFVATQFRDSQKDYYIGSLNGTSLYYKGRIDEVRVSKIVRSLPEITNEHYTIGTFSTDVNVTYTPGNLINWVSFTADEDLSGNSRIKYQFSNNNGLSYLYYKTTPTIGWITAASLSESNTLAELTPAIIQLLTLPTNTSLRIRMIFNTFSYSDYAAMNLYTYSFDANPIIYKYVPVTYELPLSTDSISSGYGSRYAKADVYKYNSYSLIDGRYISIIQPDSSDYAYTVAAMESTRLDLISLKVYGTNKYWWVLADNNDIFNPFAGIILGTVIKIPSLQRVGLL